jgi:hypothetical protein
MEIRTEILRLVSFKDTYSDFFDRLQIENRFLFKRFEIDREWFDIQWKNWIMEARSAWNFPHHSENVPAADIIGSLCEYLCSAPIVRIGNIHETILTDERVRQIQTYISMYPSQWFAIDFCLWKYALSSPEGTVAVLVSKARRFHIARLMNLCSEYSREYRRARNLVEDFGYPRY